MKTAPPKFTFYGDDFTGSAASMELLEWGGVPTIMFLEPPTPELLHEQFPDVQAIGVAGVSRSMTPAEMDGTLTEAYQALAALGARAIHYKVCSTFDSSPQIGSIGHAIDVGIETLGSQIVPVIVGSPYLERYVAFGNLFAATDEGIFRIDRHPIMSKHPVTPMTEGDLGLHLAAQTNRQIDLVDLIQLNASIDEILDCLKAQYARGVEIVVCDTMDDAQLQKLGGVLDQLIDTEFGGTPQLIVGASGVEIAMIMHWQATGEVAEPPAIPSPGEVDQIIAVSGSASPVTAAQIEWAGANGYEILRLNAARLVDPESLDAEREQVVASALEKLGLCKGVILYTALGPQDPAIEATRVRLVQLGLEAHMTSRILGTQQGMILRELLDRTGIRRVVAAGGDTSGFSARQLGIYALRAAAPITPGIPLCRAYSSYDGYDDLHIAMKGGQVGQTDFFERVRLGRQ